MGTMQANCACCCKTPPTSEMNFTPREFYRDLEQDEASLTIYAQRTFQGVVPQSPEVCKAMTNKTPKRRINDFIEQPDTEVVKCVSAEKVTEPTLRVEEVALAKEMQNDDDEHLNRFLKSRGFENINAKRRGVTTVTYPLHLAVTYVDAYIVRLLLNAEADPLKPNNDGLTPLALAVKMNTELGYPSGLLENVLAEFERHCGHLDCCPAH